MLYAYLLRVETSSPQLTKDLYISGAKAERLLNGMLSIALAHNWMDMTLQLMDMLQCFVQAVPPSVDVRPASELMQLPGFTLQAALAVVQGSTKWGPYGLQGLWKMGDAERRRLLRIGKENALMDAGQYTEMVRVLGEWPRIELVDTFFKGG